MKINDLSYNATGARYGYNSQEQSTELNQDGNHTTAEFWEYDARSARRWNLDPVVKHQLSGYNTFASNPIWFKDALGADTTIIGIIQASSEIKDAKSSPDFVPEGVKLESTGYVYVNIIEGKIKDISLVVDKQEFESPTFIGSFEPAFTEVRNKKVTINKDGKSATATYQVVTQLAWYEVIGQWAFTYFKAGIYQDNIITVTQTVKLNIDLEKTEVIYDASTFPEATYKSYFRITSDSEVKNNNHVEVLQQSTYKDAVNAAKFKETGHPNKKTKTLKY